MAFDYKKEYKEFYMPKAKPDIVTIPKMNYIAVRGSGDPNAEDGDYKAAIGLLYAVRLKGISIMWCRRWRDSGGRTELMELTMHTRKTLIGFL